jgi:hypothetical protein
MAFGRALVANGAWLCVLSGFPARGRHGGRRFAFAALRLRATAGSWLYGRFLFVFGVFGAARLGFF